MHLCCTTLAYETACIRNNLIMMLKYTLACERSHENNKENNHQQGNRDHIKRKDV